MSETSFSLRPEAQKVLRVAVPQVEAAQVSEFFKKEIYPSNRTPALNCYVNEKKHLCLLDNQHQRFICDHSSL